MSFAWTYRWEYLSSPPAWKGGALRQQPSREQLAQPVAEAWARGVVIPGRGNVSQSQNLRQKGMRRCHVDITGISSDLHLILEACDGQRQQSVVH